MNAHQIRAGDQAPTTQAPIDVEQRCGRDESLSHSPGGIQNEHRETVPVSGHAPEEEGMKRHLVEFIDQEDLTDRPIDNAARISYVGTDISNINFLVRQTDQERSVHHFAVCSNSHTNRHFPLC